MSKKQKSEFGKGFVYNLVLFSKHWERAHQWMEDYRRLRDDPKNTKETRTYFTDDRALALWFNGASDHFYELEIPEQFKKTQIGKLAKEIQSKALYFGHGFQKNLTLKDFEEITSKVEKLAMLIDQKLGVKDIKADFS